MMITETIGPKEEKEEMTTLVLPQVMKKTDFPAVGESATSNETSDDEPLEERSATDEIDDSKVQILTMDNSIGDDPIERLRSHEDEEEVKILALATATKNSVVSPNGESSTSNETLEDEVLEKNSIADGNDDPNFQVLTNNSASDDPIERLRSDDSFDGEVSKGSATGRSGVWAMNSKERFALRHTPKNIVIPREEELSDILSDELWKRYFDARSLLVDACEAEEDGRHQKIATAYRNEIQGALHDEWKGTYTACFLGPHTYQRAKNVKMDRNGELVDATVVSTIFSPFFLPRAIQLCMRYHRGEGDDFWCTWHIQFVSMKEDLEDRMRYWKPYLSDMWEVCSNGYAKMPTHEVGFMPVEEIDTSFLQPNLLRKIRKWLFGSLKSTSIVDDLSLMKYVFGTTGVVRDFILLHGDIGYTWTSREAQEDDMIDNEVNDDEIERAAVIGTNWLEFQCRLITGTLRMMDSWYDAYDIRYFKGVWGQAVLEHRFQNYGIRFKDPHVHENPDKVWDLALRGITHDG